MTIEEIIAEAVKDAVADALGGFKEDILGRLSEMDERLTVMARTISEIDTDVISDVAYSLDELADAERRRELNEQRAELRQSGALRRVS